MFSKRLFNGTSTKIYTRTQSAFSPLYLISQPSFTSFAEETVECCACGTKSNHTILRSTNELGSADLDLRPSEMARSTLPFCIQECWQCGLCLPYLNRPPQGINTHQLRSLIESEEFKSNKKQNEHLSTTVSKYHRYALLQKYTNSPNIDIATSYLTCAWLCDDEISWSSAKKNEAQFERAKGYLKEYLTKSVEYFGYQISDYNDNHHHDKSEYFETSLQYIDVLRRLNMYDECKAKANKLIIELAENKKNLKEYQVMDYIARFQIYNCELRDDAVYTIQDAEEYYEREYQSIYFMVAEIELRQPTCMHQHYLIQFNTAHGQFGCDKCRKRRFPENTEMYGCRICNYDICFDCYVSEKEKLYDRYPDMRCETCKVAFIRVPIPRVRKKDFHFHYTQGHTNALQQFI